MFHDPNFWPEGVAKAGTQRAIERLLRLRLTCDTRRRIRLSLSWCLWYLCEVFDCLDTLPLWPRHYFWSLELTKAFQSSKGQ